MSVLKLPPPPQQYDPAYEAQRNRLLELAVNSKYEQGLDVFIHPPARLIMVDEDGHHVEIYVSHSEQVRARHV
jgi:hypothetical protein